MAITYGQLMLRNLSAAVVTGAQQKKSKRWWRFYAGPQFACFKKKTRFEYLLQASILFALDLNQNKRSVNKFGLLPCKKPDETIP